jgi:hypothetical protein
MDHEERALELAAWIENDPSFDIRDALTEAFAAVKREALEQVKNSIDSRMNDALCEMKPDYDDSITGFDEAWDISRRTFKEAINVLIPEPRSADGEPHAVTVSLEDMAALLAAARVVRQLQSLSDTSEGAPSFVNDIMIEKGLREWVRPGISILTPLGQTLKRLAKEQPHD